MDDLPFYQYESVEQGGWEIRRVSKSINCLKKSEDFRRELTLILTNMVPWRENEKKNARSRIERAKEERSEARKVRRRRKRLRKLEHFLESPRNCSCSKSLLV